MKAFGLKKSVSLGLAVAGLVCATKLPAAVEVFVVGGNASSSVLFDRATNILSGGITAIYGGSSSTVRTYVGSSTNAALAGYGTITLDFNLLGAVGGLNDLVNGTTETNALGTALQVTLVDSATSPEAVGIDSVAANFSILQTYVVPLVFVKNTNSTDTAPITNLTQRQAQSLATATLPATFFGGTNTNSIYFVGRNNNAAVRTEFDANILNTSTIRTFNTNSAGLPVLDTSSDPGQASGSAVVGVVTILTNAIGTVAVQNVKKPLGILNYEGVAYTPSNVQNGSYPLWYYEHYYYITPPNNGSPGAAQLAVINALYQSVTNAAFQVSTVFTNNFIPVASLRVKRSQLGGDGGPITPLANY